MAQAWWKMIDEVPTGSKDQLYLQKGIYHFYDKARAPESGYRFIHRVNGKLQARPARIDDLKLIEDLIALGKAKGWQK